MFIAIFVIFCYVVIFGPIVPFLCEGSLALYLLLVEQFKPAPLYNASALKIHVNKIK